jgi:hypothetical protein
LMAVFRAGSITRAFRTGQVEPAIGFQPWIEGVGTLSPLSVAPSPVGVFFLGSDRQVYLLREGGLSPVGGPIREELKAVGFLPEVAGTYNPDTMEYVLVVRKGLHMEEFFLDVEKLQQGEGPSWRKGRYQGAGGHVAVATTRQATGLSGGPTQLFYSLSGTLSFSGLIYLADTQTYDRGDLNPSKGFWISPPLGDPPHNHTIHTIQKLSILVEYPDPFYDPEIQGDVQVLFGISNFVENPLDVSDNWLTAQKRRRVEWWETGTNRRVERLTFFPASFQFPDSTQDWSGLMLQFGIQLPDADVKVLGYTWTSVRRMRDD